MRLLSVSVKFHNLTNKDEANQSNPVLWILPDLGQRYPFVCLYVTQRTTSVH